MTRQLNVQRVDRFDFSSSLFVGIFAAVMPDQPDLSQYFSDTYSAARAQFLQQTERLGWPVDAHPLPAVGPAGEPLYIDVASRDGRGAAAPIL